MRKTTIAAIAAVPASLAAALFTAGGPASAATLTAAPSPVTLTTTEHGLLDTTNVETGTDLPGYGPVWAHDNLQRVVTITPDASVAGGYDVTVAAYGSYTAFANPITGQPWHGCGRFAGEVQYVVTPPACVVPVRHLPRVTDSSYRSGNVLNEAFGLPENSTALVHVPGGNDGSSNWLYFGVQGAPGGLYFQH